MPRELEDEVEGPGPESKEEARSMLGRCGGCIDIDIAAAILLFVSWPSAYRDKELEGG
jgi:hypothetical protein